MDLEEAARLIAERVNGKDSVDVGVKVEIVPAGWLNVHVHSRNPVTWFHAGVELHADRNAGHAGGHRDERRRGR